jgi:hypothetical protein
MSGTRRAALEFCQRAPASEKEGAMRVSTERPAGFLDKAIAWTDEVVSDTICMRSATRLARAPELPESFYGRSVEAKWLDSVADWISKNRAIRKFVWKRFLKKRTKDLVKPQKKWTRGGGVA